MKNLFTAPVVGPAAGAERYRTLDSMRGIAAVVVVLYHARTIFASDGWVPQFSFLAVDFFFCLSGFVIAQNYDPRFGAGMGAKKFMVLRLRRLLPLYVLGWTASAATLFVPSVEGGSLWPLSATLIFNLLLLPGILPTLFPLNPPSWSLFFELWVANLLFAAAWRGLNRVTLGLVLLVSAIGLVWVERQSHDFNIGFVYASFGGGVARVAFSFAAGVCVSRLHTLYPCRIQFPAFLILAALVVLLSMPFEGRLRALHQLFCIIIAFPALIYVGATAEERRPELGALLGDASYALYVLHWPLLTLASWTLRDHIVGAGSYPVLVATVAAATAAALALHHGYDVPVRRYLSARRAG